MEAGGLGWWECDISGWRRRSRQAPSLPSLSSRPSPTQTQYAHTCLPLPALPCPALPSLPLLPLPCHYPATESCFQHCTWVLGEALIMGAVRAWGGVCVCVWGGGYIHD